MTLPTFIIIGAQRCGTTTLHYTLARHPQIFMSPRKELNFFLRAHDGSLPPWINDETADLTPCTLTDYEAIFNDAGSQHRAVGEASPSYLFSAVAPRIKTTLPYAKMIAILRHPVDQAWSILTMWLGRPPRLEEFGKWLETSSRCGPGGVLPLSQHGRYADLLEPYFDLFPRENIQVVLFEDLKRVPDQLVAGLQDFLGVDHVSLPHLHLNASGRPRSRFVQGLLDCKGIARAFLPRRSLRRLTGAAHRVQSANTPPHSPALPSGLRHDLTLRHYGPSIRRLEDLTGLDLSGWDHGRIEEPARSDDALKGRRAAA